MKPKFAVELTNNEYKELVNKLRYCGVCHHIVEKGTKCKWCNGKVLKFEKHERKEIPSVFFDTTKVESEIDIESYYQTKQEIKREEARKKIQIQRRKEIEIQRRKEKMADKYDVQIQKDCLPGCPNKARLRHQTCSPFCTIRMQYSWFDENGFNTISDEEVVEKLKARKRYGQKRRK